MPARYRLGQFLSALASWVRPEALSEVSDHLPPEAVALFQRMPRYDRRHALNVLHTLRRQGHDDPDLFTAALLHDVGKTAGPSGRLGLWHRVAVVLMGALQPSLVEGIGRDEPGTWRYAFYLQQHHAAIGADLAREAGCSDATVALILHHENARRAAEDAPLAALRAADGSN